MGPHLDIIYKLNLALFVLLLCICIFFVLLFFFLMEIKKTNKQTKQICAALQLWFWDDFLMFFV